MDIRIKSLALFGALATTPLIAAPPPPPAPPSDGASASGQLNAQAETRTQEQQSNEQRASASAEASVEDDVALWGPLHEAFARPVSHDPVRQSAIKREPPRPIEEVPPEYRPDGDNVIWIPGYWSFEDAEDEFLWISGLWRDVPPGRRWVPGYWSQVDGGFLWTPGEWIGAERETLSYLPEPPRSQERGPSSAAPSNDHFWIPGCWEYRDRDYGWRPGYWAPHQHDWVWVPAHYDWTPNGYVYCDGYWDYDIDRRGLIYAPYRYQGRHITNYTPRTVLDVPHLMLHLFVGNRTGNYYFGDYYGRDAYRPWYTWHGSRSGYDPWRHGPDYRNRLTGWNTYFTQNQDFRPRRTLNAQRQFLSRNTNREVAAQVNIARAITGAVGSELFGRRVVDVSRSERDSVMRTAGALLSLADQRLDVESRGRGRASTGNRSNRDSATVQGRAGTLTLPKVASRILPGNQSPDAKPSKIPELPGVTNDRPGNRVDQRPNDNRGNGNGQKNNRGKGNVKDTVRDAVKGVLGETDRKGSGNSKSKTKGVIGTKDPGQPKTEQKTKPVAKPKPQPKVDPKPDPKPAPVPRPKVDPAPKPTVPDVQKPKKSSGGKRGGENLAD